jgi:hypothetical protein
MTKKHFIALAKIIRAHNQAADFLPSEEGHIDKFTIQHIETLANFCAAQNPNFNRARWLAYIDGECGPNGEAIKTA